MIEVHVKLALDGSTWRTPRSEMVWTEFACATGTGIEIERGRAHERDEVRSGTCSLTLNDFDRSLDTENADGPHYGFLESGVPIWVYVTATGSDLDWDGDGLEWGSEEVVWASVDFDRFFGFVQEFPQISAHSDADRVVRVPLDAIDAQGWALAAARQPQSVADVVIRSDSPAGYYPLDETSGIVMRDRSGNRRDGVYVHGTVAHATTAESEDGAEVPGLILSDEHYGSVKDASILPSDESMLEIVVDFGSHDWTGSNDRLVVWQMSNGNADGEFQQILLRDEADGVVVQFHRGEATFRTHISSNPLPRTGVHHIAVSYYAVPSIAVDGVDATASGFSPSIPSSVDTGFFVGGPSRLGQAEGVWDGFVAHVGIYHSPLSFVRVQAHAEAVLAPLDGQYTGERLDWLLDQAGFPATDRDIATGATLLGPANLDRQFTLDLARRVEKAEQGRFFIAKNGDATFHSRHHAQLETPTPLATFIDRPTTPATQSTYANVEIVRPKRFIFNKVTVSLDGAAPLTVEDDTSIGKRGENALTVDAPLMRSEAEQRSLAEYVLARSKDPHPRVYGMSVKVHEDFDRLAPMILPLEQGDRVAFERTPLGVGDPIVLDQILEGYSESIDAFSYTWTPRLSPAEPVTFAVWGVAKWSESVWGY